MNLKKVVIIIPTYNESLVIAETIHQIFDAVDDSLFDAHVLIFDSCSTDNTPSIILDLQKKYPNLHLKTEPQKTGLGSAYAQAMRYALDHLHADVVIEFDADLSHKPEYLMPVLEQMHTHDVVIGSRYVKGGSIPQDWGMHRKLLSKVGNWVARLILTPKYKDFTSGFRATQGKVLSKVLPEQFISHNYAYKIELLWVLHQMRAKIKEHPIEFIDREKGYSKLPANSIFDSLRVLFVLRAEDFNHYFKSGMVHLVGLISQGLVYTILRSDFSSFYAAQLTAITAVINSLLNGDVNLENQTRNQRLKSLTLFLGYSVVMVGFLSNWVSLGTQFFGSGTLKEGLILSTGLILSSISTSLFNSYFIMQKKIRTLITQ